MAYSQSKELTDTEKRLEALKTQLFGKERNEKIHSNHTNTISASTIALSHNHQDLIFLKKDLLKIIVLAIIAIFVQLVLKFVVKI